MAACVQRPLVFTAQIEHAQTANALLGIITALIVDDDDVIKSKLDTLEDLYASSGTRGAFNPAINASTFTPFGGVLLYPIQAAIW
jgi:hypothetical protein